MKLVVIFGMLFGLANCQVKLQFTQEPFREVAENFLPWLRQNLSKPVNRCTWDSHTKFVRVHDEASSQVLLTQIHNLALAGSEKIMLNFNETLIALRSRQAERIFLGEKTFISVYDFKNYLTGNHVYEFCFGFNCFGKTEVNNGNFHGVYFLRRCMSFPEFVARFYRGLGVSVEVVSGSSDFFMKIGNVAAFTTDGFLLFHGKKPRSSWSKDKRYTALFLFEH